MRWVVFLCFVYFSTAALALDDCNAKFPSIDGRLKCLQSNNNSLQRQVDALKAEIAGFSGKQSISKPMVKPAAKAEVKPNKTDVTTTQPLTRADCKEAGMQWDSSANVCGGKQVVTKPESKPRVTTPPPLTRADCKKAGMQWDDGANVCGGKQAVSKPEAKPKKPQASTQQPLIRTDCTLPWRCRF
jgi:cell division protein FtsB